jgi:hypothetical protein
MVSDEFQLGTLFFMKNLATHVMLVTAIDDRHITVLRSRGLLKISRIWIDTHTWLKGDVLYVMIGEG